MTVFQFDRWLSLAKLLVLAKASGNSQGPRDSEPWSEVDQSFAAEVVNFRAHRNRVHSVGVGKGHCEARVDFLGFQPELGTCVRYLFHMPHYGAHCVSSAWITLMSESKVTMTV